MGEWFSDLPRFAWPGAETEASEPGPEILVEHAHGWGYTRIYPPEYMREYGTSFERSEEMEEFVRMEFTLRGGTFWDPEHAHLADATVGVVWSNGRHVVKGSEKAGTMELLPDPGDLPRTWTDARKRDWLRSIYGAAWPTFQMTLSGVWAWRYDDREFFGTVDHELCHGGVAKDRHGAPKFNEKTNTPVFAMRPHDVEQFNGTVERWGAASTGAAAMVSAGLKPPRFAWVPGKDFTAAACAACAAR